MKTITTTRIDNSLRDVVFGYWDTETEEFIPLTDCDEEIRDKLGINDDLYEMLIMFQDVLQDCLGRDLKDIWERIDKVEKGNNE